MGVAAKFVGGLALMSMLVSCAGPSNPTAAPSADPLGSVWPSPTSTSATPTASSTPAKPSASPRSSPSASTRPSAKPSVRPVASPYVTTVPVPPGCLVVGPAITGVKVYLVQRALHLVGHRERFDAATTSAVRVFQAAHHLRVTGLVDATTWTALGTGYPFCIDRYTSQPVVRAGASASTRIEAMIAYATRRVGVQYLWGGAGPIGFDCSGLALQAMYAGGRVVRGLNTDLHVGADFRTTHYLYQSGLLHVPLSQRRRGDLVFYGSPITHMSIYLGNGQIVEAVRPVIRVGPLYGDGLSVQPYVVRPFP